MDPRPHAPQIVSEAPGTPLAPLKRLADNLVGLSARIEAARSRGMHAAGAVRLVAVTKGLPPAVFPLLQAAGHKDVGENRVLEAAGKRESGPRGLVWHGIGHLQTNKARKAVSTFDVFHALDSLHLATELNAVLETAPTAAFGPSGEASSGGSVRRWPVYVQVNAANDPAKGGFRPEETLAALRTVSALPHLEVVGLMTMPAEADRGEAARPTFRTLAELRDEAVKVGSVARDDLGLSMGMSDDFEIAVEEGATIVRIGRAVWDGVGLAAAGRNSPGERPPAPPAPPTPPAPLAPPEIR